ncbi:metallopeptidase TldD-related protein [Nocardioides zeae]|uniref:Metallopeptidase TldD-related protein n=1 Tax=Nocardioides imazamoxiresistens TaxID=3231893 RepID=A0ABU3PT31_9ACTN|nr:metallopeptidase TldD-related protein [Nocardioides zeae]MDT9592381.1 metallopeptidase TldD-related protein [Nocardioides zeae]
MTTTPTPQDLVERALEASRSDDAVVLVRTTSSANLRWANNTLTTNGEMRGVEVTVVAFDRRADGVAVGSITSAAASLEQVRAVVEQADAAAAAAAPAGDVSELVGGGVADDWSDPPAATSIGVYGDVAPALGGAFDSATSGGRILYGFVDHEVATVYLGSSTGLRLRHVQPTGHWACTAKPTDLSQSAWVGGATRDFTDVDPTAFDAELAQRLSWGERRIDLPAGRYDTILPPTSVADLAIYLLWISGGLDAHDGQSVWSRAGGGTRVGERVVDERVRLRSDPAHPGLEAAPFVHVATSGEVTSVFDNGLPVTATDWVRDGVLTSLLQSRHSARVTGLPPTPVPDNLVLDVTGGAGSTQDLVAATDDGLLVTSLWYIRMVDPQSALLTGLTRDGVYVVENGEVVGLANNFRFNESPVEVLGRFSHAGATVPSFSREWGDYFSRTATPALRVPDFNMSSVSEAR